MGKMKTLKVGALNIKTQPNSETDYINLFRDAHLTEKAKKVWGSDWGTIGTLREVKVDEKIAMFGQIWKFLNINPEGQWLDLVKRQALNADEDGDKIPVIPAYLKPNLKECFYLFLPHHHRLFFDAKAIASSRMRSLMIAIFSDSEIYDKYGKVDVCVETSDEAIEKILNQPRLMQLNIQFTIPNGDILTEEEEEVIEILTGQNVRQINQVLKTTDENGIKPDKNTRALAKLAKSNGRVYGVSIGSDQKKVIKSTVAYPRTETISYSEESPRLDAMVMAATALLSRI
jgi:hypothetical protein